MSAKSEAVNAPSVVNVNPWLIAVVVALAAFMEVLDTTIANVALRYISGGLGVSQDEASWVVTTYLVANAIIVTATRLSRQAIRPQDLLPGLPRAVHRQLGAVRVGAGISCRCCCSVFCRDLAAAAWCRSRNRSSRTRSRPRSEARPSLCSALPWS